MAMSLSERGTCRASRVFFGGERNVDNGTHEFGRTA